MNETMGFLGPIINALIALFNSLIGKREKENLNIKVILAPSSIGAGKEYANEFIVINHSVKTTFITKIYIEEYKFNKFIRRILWINEIDNPNQDESFRDILPNATVKEFLPLFEDYIEPNTYVRLAVFTTERKVFRSNFYSPVTNTPISYFEILKIKWKFKLKKKDSK
ncbi:hypothetical protein NSS71_11160 [Niallia sp. FSL W8-0951]|uniref:hypothetical protein n=1 Tax=Niallia sp. FSL W8-0951 TaxID=2954639 RepID=UPI0030F6304D